MKPYLLSLGIGLLVGMAYHLSGVRSPAPPVIALVGLLGILAGEQLVPTVRKFLSAEQSTAIYLETEEERSALAGVAKRSSSDGSFRHPERSGNPHAEMKKRG